MSLSKEILFNIDMFNDYTVKKYDHMKGAKVGISTNDEVVILNYANVDKRKVEKATNEIDKDECVKKAYTNVLNQLCSCPEIEELHLQGKIIVKEFYNQKIELIE